MHVVLVNIHVKPEFIEPFIQATLENAQNSALEWGIVRFDFHQSADDPTRFILLEIYKQPDDQAKHRETAHYIHWKDLVADWMAEPRVGLKFHNLYPTDENWQ